MDGTVVAVRTRLGEDETELVIRIECLGRECVTDARDRVRSIITVDPEYLGPCSNSQRRRLERKVVYGHLFSGPGGRSDLALRAR